MSDKIEIIIWEDGKSNDITDWMYWFEENGVTDIRDMKGHHGVFGIEIIVNGKTVYEN